MPVTELATFKFESGYTLDDPEVEKSFILLSSWQSEWSSYPLTFYQNVADSSVVYLVSGWQDVPAHMKWIASDKNQHLLKVFDPILSIEAFTHVEMDFGGIPKETQCMRVMKATAVTGSVEEGISNVVATGCDPKNTVQDCDSLKWKGGTKY